MKSVANGTREDIRDFLELAAVHEVLRPLTRCYRPEQANRALAEIRSGRIHGARILEIKA